MLKILYTYILRMTTGYKPPKAGASVTFFSTAVQQSQKNINQGAQKHHELLVKAGANRGGKRKKRRRKRKKGGSKSCACSGVPTTITTYTAGSSDAMSPNANDNLAASQQLIANTLCAGSLDNMGDSWSQGGGRKRKRRRTRRKTKRKTRRKRKSRKTKKRKRKRSTRRRKR